MWFVGRDQQVEEQQEVPDGNWGRLSWIEPGSQVSATYSPFANPMHHGPTPRVACFLLTVKNVFLSNSLTQERVVIRLPAIFPVHFICLNFPSLGVSRESVEFHSLSTSSLTPHGYTRNHHIIKNNQFGQTFDENCRVKTNGAVRKQIRDELQHGAYKTRDATRPIRWLGSEIKGWPDSMYRRLWGQSHHVW